MPILLVAFIVTSTLWTALSLWLSARQVACVRRNRDSVPADFTPSVTRSRSIARPRFTTEAEASGSAASEETRRPRGVPGLGTGRHQSALRRAGVGFTAVALARRRVPAVDVRHRRADAFAGQCLCGTFVLEQKFGFNRTTPLTFALDRLKSWTIALIVSVPLLLACLWAMRAFSGLWWLWTWFGVLALMLAAPTVYVRLVAPRFNRFTPLGEGGLRARIETLLSRCGFRSSGLFSMDASRRSAHGNAYFIGFGNTKRVVLFDTLIDNSTPEEVEAVVAHELGHFRHGHILFGMLRGAVMAFVVLAAFGWLTRQPWLLSSFGILYQDDALALLACLLLNGMVGPLFGPIGNWISRRNEFQADDYARRHVGAEPMISALLRLSRDNASTLTPDPLYALVHYSHLPVPIRIRHLHEA